MRKKALLLFSGGLDSLLAAKILADLGIDVTALTYVGYFFDAGQAKKSARENNINFISKDFSKKHFEVVKNPRFGRGAGMNPCIDCHLLMIRKAKKIAEKEGYDFIATGEVLGQRPMSQNSEALKLIEQKAEMVGKILRPLSARVLPETEYEKKGLVLREKLYGLSGRSRKGQIELARKLKIKHYPSPAGGCILTDKNFSEKLKDLLEKAKKIKPSDLELLRVGRHFWTCPVRSNGNEFYKRKSKRQSSKTRASDGGGVHIILGRNHEENLKLKKLAEKNDVIIEPKNFPGPSTLLRGKSRDKDIKLAKEKILQYTKKGRRKGSEFVICEV